MTKNNKNQDKNQDKNQQENDITVDKKEKKEKKEKKKESSLQFSTVISDGFLASVICMFLIELSTIIFANDLKNIKNMEDIMNITWNPLGKKHRLSLLLFITGNLIVGIAAFFGTFRFMGIRCIRPIHDLFTNFGKGIGMPFIFFSFYSVWRQSTIFQGLFSKILTFLNDASGFNFNINGDSQLVIFLALLQIFLVVFIILTLVLGSEALTLVGTPFLILNFINIIVPFYNQVNVMVGFGLIIVSGLFGGKGKILGIKKVDIFHYLFAPGLYFMYKTFVQMVLKQ